MTLFPKPKGTVATSDWGISEVRKDESAVQYAKAWYPILPLSRPYGTIDPGRHQPQDPILLRADSTVSGVGYQEAEGGSQQK